MSHYTVMVVGTDPEELLAPYSENIEIEAYFNSDVSDEEIKSCEDFYREKYPEETKEMKFMEIYKEYGDDWNGDTWRISENEDGSLKAEEWSTYNPDSKWDWYQLGGRWADFFLTEGGTHADSCMKKLVDLDGMKEASKKLATIEWEYINEFIGGLKLEHKWTDLLKGRDEKTITLDEAREIYHNQEVVKAFEEAKKTEAGRKYVSFFGSVEEYMIDKEEYIENAMNASFSTYAILDKDGWHSKGEMGWFGMSSNNVSDTEWCKSFNEYFNALDGETIVSIYDLHI